MAVQSHTAGRSGPPRNLRKGIVVVLTTVVLAGGGVYAAQSANAAAWDNCRDAVNAVLRWFGYVDNAAGRGRRDDNRVSIDDMNALARGQGLPPNPGEARELHGAAQLLNRQWGPLPNMTGTGDILGRDRIANRHDFEANLGRMEGVTRDGDARHGTEACRRR